MPGPPVVYRFGRFRVDTREQRVTRDNVALAVTPKVFDTLVMFLRHAGRLLTKEELLQGIWPDTAVEEANLTVNVSTLRKLLAEADESACIETVPRRGYCFVHRVDIERADEIRTRTRPDRPSSVRAQELYARANQSANEADRWETARDLYQACVEEAPDFAPAWARLARCHRTVAKFTTTPALRETARIAAESAFQRALALDPTLPLTHSLYAQLEVDRPRPRCQQSAVAIDRARRPRCRRVCRTGPRAPILRPARGLARRARSRACTRSGNHHQRRAHLLAPWRLQQRAA